MPELKTEMKWDKTNLHSILLLSLWSHATISLRKTFNDATKLGIDHPDVDTLIADRTKTLALCNIHDDDHFINDFLSKCPSGRYCTVKYRTMWGRDSFLLIHVLNNVFFKPQRLYSWAFFDFLHISLQHHCIMLSVIAINPSIHPSIHIYLTQFISQILKLTQSWICSLVLSPSHFIHTLKCLNP